MTADAPVHCRTTARWTRENPWPGLEAFREEDQDYFHGRRCRDRRVAPPGPARAAHRPLRRVRSRQNLSPAGRPLSRPAEREPAAGPHPPQLLRGHAGALSDQIKEAIAHEATSARIEAPSLEGTLWESFHREHADFWNSRNRVVTPLLVFDQFEEIFTRGPRNAGARARHRDAADRARGSDRRLRPGGRQGPDRCRIRGRRRRFPSSATTTRSLLSLREDFLADLESLRDRLPSIMRNRLRLCPMNGEQALSAVDPGGRPLDRPRTSRPGLFDSSEPRASAVEPSWRA